MTYYNTLRLPADVTCIVLSCSTIEYGYQPALSMLCYDILHYSSAISRHYLHCTMIYYNTVSRRLSKTTSRPYFTSRRASFSHFKFLIQTTNMKPTLFYQPTCFLFALQILNTNDQHEAVLLRTKLSVHFYGNQGNRSLKYYPAVNFKRPFLSVYKQLINIISVSNFSSLPDFFSC